MGRINGSDRWTKRAFRRWHFTTWLWGMLAIALVVLLPTWALPAVANAPKAKIEFVSPQWLSQHLSDTNLRVLDVRNSPLDYIGGHVPGAVHIADLAFRGPDGFLPVQYWDNEKIASLFGKAGVNNRQKVAVYSNGNDVLGATMVAYLLERSGVKDIAIVDGGFAGYQASGQTVTKEYPRYDRQTFQLKDDPSVRVTLADVRKLIGQPNVAFIDPRPPELFSGEKPLWVRNGHIPGARNIPWPTFTEANNSQEALKNPHKLKSLDEIRQILASRNITPDKQIIVSCSTGREATLQYVVLKHLLGYPNVRIYEGSWTEYSTTDLPVETGPDRA